MHPFMKLVILIFSVVAVSACVQQAEIKDIYINGHGNQIYQFSYDIRESVKIPSDNEREIRNLIAVSDKVTVIFNSTSGEDNAVFQVVVFNLAAKLPTYFSYEGKLLYIDILYYGEDGLYNKSNSKAELPTNTKIRLLGPHTGAEEGSVRLDGNTITVQGTTPKNLVLAGDKLALVVMGIDEEKIKQDISTIK